MTSTIEKVSWMKRAYIYARHLTQPTPQAMNRDYRYRLDNSRPRIKVTCPACGRAKKLVRYVDTQTGQFLAEYVGKCDRIFKCGYHYTPADYFRDRPWLREVSSWQQQPSRLQPTHQRIEPTRQPSFIEPNLVTESMNRCQSSALFRFLSSLWGNDETLRLFRLYNVGATHKMNCATIFWQTDINGRIRTGKVMRYGSDGHRIKADGVASITWMHRMKAVAKAQPDFNLVQCFFGEHLLPIYRDAKVMIVESEKSAIIAAHYYPQFLWLASGGCCGCLNQSASQVLKGREVWLVPDLDAEDRWRDKLAMLRSITPTVGIVTSISDMATPEQRAAKLDIADFLLDAERHRNPIVGADDGVGQLAE